MTTLRTAPFHPRDAEALTQILNDIIATGGTTAFQTPFTVADLRAELLDGPTVVSCQVVLAGDTPIGFQSLNIWPDTPKGTADIATFTQQTNGIRGAGLALFEATQVAARKLNLTALNAVIRADNAPGLGYYAKIGFVDFKRHRDVPLADGSTVDRIHRLFTL